MLSTLHRVDVAVTIRKALNSWTTTANSASEDVAPGRTALVVLYWIEHPTAPCAPATPNA